MAESAGDSTVTEPVSLDSSPNILDIATERKHSGNDFFRQSNWNEAIAAYQSALNVLPPSKGKAREGSPDLDEPKADSEADPPAQTSNQSSLETAEVADKGDIELISPAVTQLEDEFRKLRAVLHANIGACYVKLGDHKAAVESCSDALLHDPGYVKALERRASSNEALATWSSLTSAQDDYNSLLKLATTPSQTADIKRKLQRLGPRVEAAQKKETDEMLTKLKGFGNSILGTFGLSTDNFKFEPNGQGGYSVNFSR